ncbi:MAG: hypothetical protein M1611_01560 [Candidatus Marsarchaeota archaeon]|jgi:N-acetylglutamate synthase-like GNAT family acetyltransferase|nr:hypothetical protein [Candidatus Marsarchaeota archaeon]
MRNMLAQIETAKKPLEAYAVTAAHKKDLAGILRLVNGEAEKSGAVLGVTKREVKAWIRGRKLFGIKNRGLSFVAKTPDGTVIGHQAMHVWPESGWWEHRAVVTAEAYRSNGVNASITAALMAKVAEKDPDSTIVSLKNSASNGRRILDQLGFTRVDDHSKIPSEIFSIGTGGKWEVFTAAARDVKENLTKLKH